MKRRRMLSIIGVLFGTIGLLAAVPGFSQNCIIDGFNSARDTGGWSIIDGPNYTGLRSRLLNSAFFSSSRGAVPFGITLGGGQSAVTSGSLSNVGVFITGRTPTTSYTLSERTALYNFVLNGGSLITSADSTDYSLVDLFGVTQLAGNGSTTQQVTDSNHVVLKGPFGSVSTLVPYGNVGQFSVVPGNAVTLAENISGSGNPTAAVVILPAGALGPLSGRVVILNDSNYGSDIEPAGVHDDDVLLLNAIAYACFVPDIPGGNTYYFPQIATNGGYTTYGMATSALSTSSVSHVNVNYFDDNGNPLPSGGCNLPTLSSNGTLSCVSATAFAAPVQTGWARISSNSYNPFDAELKFLYADVAGNPLTAVGVDPSTPGRKFTLAGDVRPTTTMGIAFLALPTDLAPANIMVQAFDFAGNPIGNTASFVLGPGQHTAAFADQATLTNVPRSANTNVSIVITSDQQISVLGLAADDPGFKLSSIPTLPGRR